MTKEELLKKLISQEDFTAAVGDIIAYVVTNRKAIDAAASTLTGKVSTLIGSDTGKSARAIAAEEIAAQLIPATAKEALDTLQEIAAWIQAHPDDAAAMNQAISDLSDYVGTLPQETEETTVVGYIIAEIAAVKQLIQSKNVTATGETGADALIQASASNNAVSVESTQKLKDAVALAESAVQNVKTINGTSMTGTGDVDLPAKLEVNNIESISGALLETLRVGDVVIKNTSAGKHAYKVSYKGANGLSLTYEDCDNVETIAYVKSNDVWAFDSKDVTPISTAIQPADLDFIGTTQAKAIVAQAIIDAESE